MNHDGNGKLDPEPQPQSSDPAAPSGSRDVPAGGANNEPAPNAGDGITDEIPFHPLAGIFPMINDESLQALARDIREREHYDAIIMYEGQILDGRGRYRACLLAGIPPRFETYEGDDPLGCVISRNIHRRHLLKESQRAMVAARIANLELGANQYRHSQGVPIGIAAEWLKVGVRSIHRARHILAHGIPDLVKAVDEGTIAISPAEHICNFSERDQRERIRQRGLPLSAEVTTPSPSVIPDETSPPQAETEAAPPKQADGSGETDTGASDAPEAGQAQPASASTSLENASDTSATELESPEGTPRHASVDWIWHRYIPIPGVTGIVGSINAPTTLVATLALTMSPGGQIFWLTAQRGVRSTLSPLFAFPHGLYAGISFLEAPTDDFHLPIHNLGNALRWLDHEISTSSSNVRLVVVDYLFPYLASGELEQSIHMLRPVFAHIHEIAVKRGVAMILPCQLPCRGGSSAMTKAIDALAAIPELQALLLVKGTDKGTIVAKKGLTGGNTSAVDFRTNKSGSFDTSVPPIVLLENGVAPKSAKKPDAF
jgi:hypothetical protein